jgi:hypothetical protein
MEFTTIANAKKQTGFAYLGKINTSSKLIRNLKVGHYTYSLNLSPANTSGYNTCPYSTPECRLGCLATSGRSAIEFFSGKHIIKNCRINKTKLFYENETFFMQWLIADLKLLQIKAKKDGFFISARLNTISDIDWSNIFVNNLNIFEIFPEIQFYDYTKNFNKFEYKPSNYHLTYSHTGRNIEHCLNLLSQGHTIAVVFNVKHESDLPKYFMNHIVVNGDETDYRPNDPKGCVVGLKWKRIGDRKAEKKVLNSCFVIDPITDERCSNVPMNVQVENYSNVQIETINSSIYKDISVMV